MRSLVQLMFAALCWLAMTPAFSKAPARPLFAMDTAFRSSTVPLEGKLDYLKELGYSGLSWPGTNVPEIDAVLSATKARDLQFHALYVRTVLTTSGVQLPSNFDELCATLSRGNTIMWLYVEGTAFKPSDTAADEVAVRTLRPAAERAARYDVKLALYPHRGYWVEKFSDGIRVSEKVDRANLGISFNLCHALAEGEEAAIPELLQRAGNRLFIVTINGADANSPNAGWDRLIRPLGQGSYDVRPLLRQLDEMHFKGPVGFQAFGIPGDFHDILRVTMECWRTINR